MCLDNYPCSRLPRAFFETQMSLNCYKLGNGGKIFFKVIRSDINNVTS